MTFKVKCMYLGTKDIHSKEGKNYHTIALLDLETQSTFILFVNDDYLLKIKDYKLYQNYDFDLVLSVGKNNFLRLGVAK